MTDGYREPHPVRLPSALGGAAAGMFWLWLWLTHTPPSVGPRTGVAIGWLLGAAATIGLTRSGDRGVAVGTAVGLALGGAIAVLNGWITGG
ncbi:hypothetical protein GCM10010123_44060 [Pilimelia anulata]|uniref:Uncharacterized protein n=1 Tax=Pilimelia anulata TaxID=53371 RepID=A0A8J3BK27_9ACTN|nr:hypothetical protein [Pilimelia anulata]GGK09356.1 hypothetical protein GCM10010123_44060 [Pilimelia anulata]